MSGVTHYTKRLSEGMTWLEQVWEMLKTNDTLKVSESFDRNLHGWADLEEEMRRIYPEYKDCPVGGCRKSMPVKCDTCA
jgi:hypothetical protein|tara:strand:+ start:142 stop:378 length:237 start_codon:yes stop_codon:yes gene_type:complete